MKQERSFKPNNKRSEAVKFDQVSRRDFITGFAKRRSARKLKGQRRAALESREKHLADKHSVRKHMSAELKRSEASEGIQSFRVLTDSTAEPTSHSTSYKQATLDRPDNFGDVTVLTTTW